uniref:HDC02915 n=1 Tax=Drosophila melanogaster TaxID=7227 RepID=Q6IHA4_DROME|nr:TPA_inf: HDC02915 [Drosophila melanogaster]
MCAEDPFTQHQLPHHHKTEHHQCHQQLRMNMEQQDGTPGARKSATARTAATSLQIWYILHVILVLIASRLKPNSSNSIRSRSQRQLALRILPGSLRAILASGNPKAPPTAHSYT